MVTCCGDVGTRRFIQSEVENIPIRMSPYNLGFSKYGTASFCHKILLGPGQIFKRENKMLCWLLTQKIITSALSHSTLFSRLGGQCLMLAGASVRYELITCCWFIVILAGREYSKLDYCWRHSELILLWFYWWCAKLYRSSSGISIGQVNSRSEGLCASCQWKGRKNLNTQIDFIKLLMSVTFLPKFISTCCDIQLLWKRPLISLPWSLQENNTA